MQNPCTTSAWRVPRALEDSLLALRRLGFEPPHRVDTTIALYETPVRASLRELQACVEARGAFVQDVKALVDRGIPVCVHARDPGDDPVGSWQAFCRTLAALSPSPAAAPLALCVYSHPLPLDVFQSVTDALFGRGPRYVYLDGLQMNTRLDGTARKRNRANWDALWTSCQSGQPLLPVYGGIARSSCPLLADEAADTVLPVSGLQLPADSACLPLRLNLARFTDNRGDIDEVRLTQSLRVGLAEADGLLDHLTWPTAAQRGDARANRRIAVVLTGIGDLVAARRADPTRLACLRDLEDLLGRLRETLEAASAELASVRGPLPSLDNICAANTWFEGSHGDAWQACFNAARQKTAVRHRSLLSLSPYAILPRSDHSDPGYTDLLPLLRYADTWSFADPASFAGWSCAQFRHFHERARATIQSSQASSLVAASV
jgi:hypothetical protein